MKATSNFKYEDIIESFNEINIEIVERVPLKGKSEIRHSYLLSIPNSTSIEEIRKLDRSGNVKIERETYIKRKSWTQCHRCQAFGHGDATCHRAPKCVKYTNISQGNAS